MGSIGIFKSAEAYRFNVVFVLKDNTLPGLTEQITNIEYDLLNKTIVCTFENPLYDSIVEESLSSFITLSQFPVSRKILINLLNNNAETIRQLSFTISNFNSCKTFYDYAKVDRQKIILDCNFHNMV